MPTLLELDDWSILTGCHLGRNELDTYNASTLCCSFSFIKTLEIKSDSVEVLIKHFFCFHKLPSKPRFLGYRFNFLMHQQTPPMFSYKHVRKLIYLFKSKMWDFMYLLLQPPLRRLVVIMAISVLDLADLKNSDVELLYEFSKF